MEQHFLWLHHWADEVTFVDLRDEITWSTMSTTMFGANVTFPRLTGFQADNQEISYSYSGVKHFAAHWTTTLSTLKSRLIHEFSIPYNGCLANYYRDGRDYMGWHSDDEKELDCRFPIALLSFGTVRRFGIRPLEDRSNQRAEFLHLRHGDLLILKPSFQRAFKHNIPKALKIEDERISLTFRVFR